MTEEEEEEKEEEVEVSKGEQVLAETSAGEEEKEQNEGDDVDGTPVGDAGEHPHGR